MPRSPEEHNRQRGKRAEEVAEWYFRLNGFMAIPGFVVHLDYATPYITERQQERIAWTEADLMAVRLPHSCEIVGGRTMQDAPILTNLTPSDKQTLFVLVEVKAGECSINTTWAMRQRKNVERAIRRMGFASNEAHVRAIASEMYDKGRWENGQYVLQHICVGNYKKQSWPDKPVDLLQIEATSARSS